MVTSPLRPMLPRCRSCNCLRIRLITRGWPVARMRMMSQKTKPAKVLVVDDDPVLRDMMVDMLDFEGYPIQIVRNGNEALNILRGEGNFLVFLDLMMPGLSGRDVCAILDAEP